MFWIIVYVCMVSFFVLCYACMFGCFMIYHSTQKTNQANDDISKIWKYRIGQLLKETKEWKFKNVEVFFNQSECVICLTEF